MCSIQVPTSNLMQFNQSEKLKLELKTFEEMEKKSYILVYFFFLHLFLIGAPLVV